jgi:hypothetical protein
MKNFEILSGMEMQTVKGGDNDKNISEDGTVIEIQ